MRALFKSNTFTPEAVSGAYLTGILPIKKYNHQFAVSDFWEYTMVDPGEYASYIGFDEAEVEGLCAAYSLDPADVRRWYDGYEVAGVNHVYAPYSTMQACMRGKTGSYWVTTEAYESLRYARIEELPGGEGLADIVYLPRCGEQLPAFVVELKWDKPVAAAIDQIRKNDYPAVLRDLDIPVLLVGVTYDAKTKEHSCAIELLGE